MDLFNLIHASNPTKVKIESRPRAPHEVPLLTLTANRVIEMDDSTAAKDSSGVPSTIERSPLDFAQEAEASDQGTAAPKMPSSEDVPAIVAPGAGQAEELTAADPPAAAESRKRGRDGIDVNAPPKAIQRQLSPTGGNGVTAALEIRTGGKATEDVRCSGGSPRQKDSGPFSDLQVSNERLSQQVATLQQQVFGEEKLKDAFKEFKRHQEDQVEQRCAEMEARLDALSIDFDEELYPHMLTAIAGRRWVIGRGLRLAVMKCGESLELRQAFADVVSTGIAKGLSEEAEAKFVAALQALKDLKYPSVDQLEGLKDAPIDVIIAALYLESDTRDDAPQDIRNLRPISSQLTIPVRAEKKKKCRIVCRTHGVGSAHHAWSDGVPVSAPTVVPQGLALLLANAATQTELENDT
nr:hypothetical protein [Tanacetum cinerariifolium]